MTDASPPRPDDDPIKIAIRASEKYLALHERGPMGRIEAHRTFRHVGIIKCPVCQEQT